MPARASEAIVLRTFPLQEADLIVSFLTRDHGKLRGVAKRARKPKGGFGAGLERLSHVRMSYFQRENRELVNIDSCELIHSQFGLLSDYAAGVALDYIAEVSEQLLPAAEANEKFFRLLLAVLDHLPLDLWRSVLYFSYWAVRLAGFLPDLHVCLQCGNWLDDPEAPERAYFSRADDGLLCSHCRKPNSWEMSAASRQLAGAMARSPAGDLAGGVFTQDTASDLRRYLVQRIEETIERKLVTVPVLEACDAQ